MAIQTTPLIEQYNKRALPSDGEVRPLTDFLTRELSAIDRGIKSSILTPTRTVTASGLITVADGLVLADASGGMIELTLPDARINAGRAFIVKKTDAGSDSVFVYPAGTALIDGDTEVELTAQGQAVAVVSNGVDWEITSQAFILAPGGITGLGTPGTLPVWDTSSSLGDSIVSQSGGTVSVAGALTIASTLTANGNTVLGNATSDTLTLTARVASDIVPSTANTRDIGSSTLPFRSGYFGTRMGIGFTGAISTDVNLDVVSQFGVRPSTSYSYPTVLAGGFGGRFYTMHDAGDWGFVIARSANDTLAANLTLYHTRSTNGSRTALVNGDLLGRMTFQGVSQTGGTVNIGASIIAITNGAISAGVLPTELRFYAAASGDADSSLTSQCLTIAPTLITSAVTLALGANSLTMTGSIGATGARVLKGWFTDLEVTNPIAGSITGNAATATALANTRTLWGQNFNGTANVTGSLTSVGDITGTAGVTLTATAATLGLVATGNNVITGTVNGTEALRLVNNANASGTEFSLWNPNGPVVGRIPLNAASGLLTSTDGGRFGRRATILEEASNAILRIGRFNNTWASPTAVGVGAGVGGFAFQAYDGTGMRDIALIDAFTRDTISPTAAGGRIRFLVNDIGTASLKSIFQVRGGGTNIGEFFFDQPTSRFISGSTGLAFRDSTNASDTFTVAAAGTAVTFPLATTISATSAALSIASAVLAAGSTTNALSVTTTGAINTSLRYDASNRLDVSISSAGAVTFDAVGASAGFAFLDALAVTGALSTTTTLTTGAPSGAAGAWRLGSLITAAVTPDTTRYLEVSVGGTVYKVIVST